MVGATARQVCLICLLACVVCSNGPQYKNSQPGSESYRTLCKDLFDGIQFYLFLSTLTLYVHVVPDNRGSSEGGLAVLVGFDQDLGDLGTSELGRGRLASGEHFAYLGAAEVQPIVLAVRAGLG